MAEKRFYSFIETCQRLGKTEQEVQQLIREGKLNPLRSGQRGTMNFRVEEVHGLMTGSAGKDEDFEFMDELAEVESSPSDALTIESGGDVGLSESIGLGLNPEDEDLGLSESFLPPGTEPVATADESDVVASEPKAGSDAGQELPLSSESFGFATDEVEAIQEAPTVAEKPEAEAPQVSEATTAEPESEVAVEPEPPRISPTLGGSDVIDIEEVDAASRAAEADDTVITQVGINVFDDREVQVESDPLAETVITPSAEDQMSMEGAGSGGSGLLDLSRENDESSFGELLEEIPVGEAGSTIGSEVAAESDVAEMGELEEAEEVEEVVGPAEGPIFAGPAREIEAPDPTGAAYTWLSAVAFLVMGVAMVIIAGAMQGGKPVLLESLQGTTLLIVTLAVLAGAFVVFLPIWIIGRGKAAQQRAFQDLQG